MSRGLIASMVSVTPLVNDRYGHLAGDQVLLHIARVFQTTARASDLIGRYGGEEFGVILRRTDSAGAGVLARKLRAALQDNPARLPSGDTIPVKACMGIAAYPSDAGSAGELVHLADLALYRAKKAGRDRLEFAGRRQRNSEDIGGRLAGVVSPPSLRS